MATTTPVLHLAPQQVQSNLSVVSFGNVLHHSSLCISTSTSTPGYSPAWSTFISTPASFRPVSCSASASEQAENDSFSPPTSKEEAIAQARTCLASALARPLSNPATAGRFKKHRQPRFRLEIPVFDDSPESFSRVAVDTAVASAEVVVFFSPTLSMADTAGLLCGQPFKL